MSDYWKYRESHLKAQKKYDDKNREKKREYERERLRKTREKAKKYDKLQNNWNELKNWLESWLENDKYCYLAENPSDKCRCEVYKELLNKMQELQGDDKN